MKNGKPYKQQRLHNDPRRGCIIDISKTHHQFRSHPMERDDGVRQVEIRVEVIRGLTEGIYDFVENIQPMPVHGQGAALVEDGRIFEFRASVQV